ncbi:hypothetical protein B0A50_05018 [Salinomyces thailandicus]|uniref:Uncharacterized protein n=1 Tax=Salinomyces thailandicus TaxID=706561 RepID=A0A4U0TZD5_9PEZI|nr:hypothetical protein B0A50_05018 [Salinomyces thailandica]
MRAFLKPASSRAIRSPFVPQSAPRHFVNAARLRLKEDKPQTPEEVEHAKNEQMKGNKDARKELSSSSEASLHADKEQPADKESHIEDLQQQTAGKSEREHPHGKAEK